MRSVSLIEPIIFIPNMTYFHGKKCSNLTLKKNLWHLVVCCELAAAVSIKSICVCLYFRLETQNVFRDFGIRLSRNSFHTSFFPFFYFHFFISAWSLYHCILRIFMPCRRSPCCNLWVSFSSFHSLWPKSWFRWSFYTRKKSRKTLPVEFVDS